MLGQLCHPEIYSSIAPDSVLEVTSHFARISYLIDSGICNSRTTYYSTIILLHIPRYLSPKYREIWSEI
jgi:hypothetical protein